MSSIYIQEPSTTGKVLLKTTFGDIDIELWAREAPKACRNFVQLCMEGFYDNTIFHRVIKGFIGQGGDPTGTGDHSESIYGAPFKDEIHSRLRFSRRGLVALANAGRDDNGSQFFFTFGPTPELQGKHTIFGKIAGDTIYNLLKLEEALVDQEDRPIYEQKITKTVILNNPFDDIIPRIKEKKDEEKSQSKKKKQEPGVKNFKLLSFGDEAEEDEIETTLESRKFEGKSKSTHDVLNDPKLSSKTISDELNESSENEDEEVDIKKQLEDVRKKLQSGKSKEKNEKPKKTIEYDDDELGTTMESEKKRKLEEIRTEIKNFKREVRQEKKVKLDKEKDGSEEKSEKTEVVLNYEKEKEKYETLKKKISLKGDNRQDFVLSVIKKFSNKLQSAKFGTSQDDKEAKAEEEAKAEAEAAAEVEKNKQESDEWLTHTMQCSSSTVLAKDANTKSDDWFDIYDPRHPVNVRRREGGKPQSKEKKKHKKIDE